MYVFGEPPGFYALCRLFFIIIIKIRQKETNNNGYLCTVTSGVYHGCYFKEIHMYVTYIHT